MTMDAEVFPTRVGMNRATIRAVGRANSVPHTRGDEPKAASVGGGVVGVFPTRVGMNRRSVRNI